MKTSCTANRSFRNGLSKNWEAHYCILRHGHSKQHKCGACTFRWNRRPKRKAVRK